jgi:hypothetical protein
MLQPLSPSNLLVAVVAVPLLTSLRELTLHYRVAFFQPRAPRLKLEANLN